MHFYRWYSIFLITVSQDPPTEPAHVASSSASLPPSRYFFKTWKVLLGKEIWAHNMTPNTKEQNHRWPNSDSLKLMSFKQTVSAGKVVATIFWNKIASYYPLSRSYIYTLCDRVIVVRVHSCWDNNKCWLLLLPVDKSSLGQFKTKKGTCLETAYVYIMITLKPISTLQQPHSHRSIWMVGF